MCQIRLMYIDYYKDENILSLIVDLFQKEGINVSIDNIKSWSQPKMYMNDVILGANWIKSIGEKCLIYTNEVTYKNIITNHTQVKIYDIKDIADLAKKYQDFKVLDYITD